MILSLLLGAGLSFGGFLLGTSALGLGRSNLIDRLEPQKPRNSWAKTLAPGPFGFPVLSGFARFGGSSSRRLRSALFELPEILELMAVALTAGDGLFAAFARVVPRARGVLAAELMSILVALELGGDFDNELKLLAQRLPQRQVVEFANKLLLSLKRGSPLAVLLRDQASSARAEIRNDLLRQAGRNETRMLIPLVFLILPVTVLFAIYPSLQLLNINYL
jgi:Flp pilus assembly protein TadB